MKDFWIVSYCNNNFYRYKLQYFLRNNSIKQFILYIYRSPEIRTTSRQNNSRRHDDSDLHDRDYFLNNLLLRQRQLRRSAKRPCFNFYKENDGFISYDHVYYRIMSQNGDKSVVYQYIRSKL